MESTKTEERKPIRGRRIKTVTKSADLVRERRDSLINAASRVFIEKGFHNATVRDIGRAAGMTQGTIYNYVRSKDDILYMVCDRIVTEYQQQALNALENQRIVISNAADKLEVFQFAFLLLVLASDRALCE